MGQVPALTSFLVIGSGHLARHMRRYLELQKLPHKIWNRSQNTESELHDLSAGASHVLLAISDHSIQSFFNAHAFFEKKICVHFSGALVIKNIPSAHPLMTFANEMYDLATYQSIPFIIEAGGPALTEILPGFNNVSYALNPEHKDLYHALCVLSGNFTILLWEKAFSEFAKLGLPKQALLPYLGQTAINLTKAPSGKSVLTGPLVRGDHQTIQRHINTLKNDPFGAIYKAFVEHAAPSNQFNFPKKLDTGEFV